MFKNLALVLVFCFSVNQVLSASLECKHKSLYKPCLCHESENTYYKKDDKDTKVRRIECSGNVDLGDVFKTLSKELGKKDRHFNSLMINNMNIKELGEKLFHDITFDNIYVHNNPELTKIDPKAFHGTDEVTKLISINDNAQLSSSSDNSIFKVLSHFDVLEHIELKHNNISEIPSEAFLPDETQQASLISISLYGKAFKKLGSNAFQKYQNLQVIDIEMTSIDYIPDNAFEFENSSNQTLEITFHGNDELKSAVNFGKNAFHNTKRNVKVVGIDLAKLGITVSS